jgi:hypothetical protein
MPENLLLGYLKLTCDPLRETKKSQHTVTEESSYDADLPSLFRYEGATSEITQSAHNHQPIFSFKLT